jgi:hypothetical protein
MQAHMPKVRVAGFGVSLDGFSAGTEQSLNDPLGKRGPEIFQWFFHTKTLCAMHGQEGGSVDLDDEFARRSMQNFGAFIPGRNMFGPVRGPWPDGSWKGWWRDMDVRIGGGVSTVRQYLQAGLIDSLHFALVPVVLGQGEALFTGLDLPAPGFSVTEHKATEQATHFVLEKG